MIIAIALSYDSNANGMHYATRPCNISCIISRQKPDNFQLKYCDLLSYFSSNHRLRVHVRTASVRRSTQNLCFRAKVRKYVYPSKLLFYYIKVGCKGVFITWTCLHDVFWMVPCISVNRKNAKYCGFFYRKFHISNKQVSTEY